jgi:GNAT superfamily N-acetyltransferase
VIRTLKRADLKQVSALIQNTLMVTNTLDYDLKVIGHMVAAYSPERLAEMAHNRKIYIYEQNNKIHGVIGLENGEVYNFFVAPDRQGSGIGKALLERIEKQARREGARRVTVNSSITAASFYTKMGYVRTGERSDEHFGRTILMEKKL